LATDRKAELRRQVLARREAMGGRAEAGAALVARVKALPAFAAARLIASYVGVGSEAPTVPLLEAALARGATVAVPWRNGPELRLAGILSLDELEPASFGLLEPPEPLRRDPARAVEAGAPDLYLVPGVAFDPAGGRLGHGRGFYDRLLRQAGPGPLRVALGFECQLVTEVPMSGRDEPVDGIVTEARVVAVSARMASAVR